MQFKKQHIIPVIILTAGFIIMISLFGLKDDQPKRKPVVHKKIVQAGVVQLSEIPTVIKAYGRLTSVEPVVLFSEVAGNIERGSTPFLPGQSFKKGYLLLKIDDREIKFNLNSLKSDLLNALATVLPEIKMDFPQEYEIYQDYFNKISFDKPLPPLPGTQNPKIKLFLSRFNVYKLYFSVKNMEIQLEDFYFYAPFDGSIITADMRVGSSARPGSKLGEIISLSDLEVEVPVPAQDIEWITRSLPVKLTSAEISGSWQGKITRIGKNIDPATQSVQVFVSINKKDQAKLYNGVFLTAHISGKVVNNGFSFPRKALYDEKYVYFIEDGKLTYKPVSVARKQTSDIILNGGIQNGDTLVTEVLQGVADGMPAAVRDIQETGDAN